MNFVFLKGRLCKDPELNKVEKGGNILTVCRFCIAVPREKKGAGCEWINCVCWGKSGERIHEFFCKGKEIIVSGEWRTGSYQGKNGKVYTNDCMVLKWDFCGSRAENPVVDNTPVDDSNNFDIGINGGFNPSNFSVVDNDDIGDIPFN